MIPMMVKILMQTPNHESESDIEQVVRTYVANTTGKQTIYQMIRLAEEIEKRGGSPEEPLVYKNLYHDLLMERIVNRLQGLREGRIPPVEMVVPGALEAVKRIHNAGIACFLASGTDEKYVLDEAALLGLPPYFAGIYGAQDDYRNFSKRMVIQRIIRENHLQGPELIAFAMGMWKLKTPKLPVGLRSGWRRMKPIGPVSTPGNVTD